MAYLIEAASEFYNSITYDIDPRMKDWPLIQSAIPGSLLILAYLLFVYFGPKWMANRPPLQIRSVVVLYNVFMIFYSAFSAYEVGMGMLATNFSLSCNWTTDYSNTPGAIRMAAGVWYFFIAKFIELLDTVFFILRKKNSQVTFLHVFHHGCLPMLWWWGIKAVPGGFGVVHGFINCLVHVVMYTYYSIASLGPQYQKYLWWKKYVTVFQLVQFGLTTLHNSQYLFVSCKFPWKYVVFIQVNTSIVAVLFMNFYIQTYLRGKKKPEKREENKSQTDIYTNGHNISNGHTYPRDRSQISNGHVTGNGNSLRERTNISN